MGTETDEYERILTFLLESHQALKSGRTWAMLGAKEDNEMSAEEIMTKLFGTDEAKNYSVIKAMSHLMRSLQIGGTDTYCLSRRFSITVPAGFDYN